MSVRHPRGRSLLSRLFRLPGMSTHRLVIVGGGFAGVWAAMGAAAVLRQRDAEERVAVTLVSPDGMLVIRPRLYEADLGGVCVPLDLVLSPLRVDQRRAEVSTIDVDRRVVTLVGRDGGELRYDQLVLCAGSRLQLPAKPGVHCADSYRQALAMHQAVSALSDRSDSRFTAVVVGGGFTGLEVAAELSDILRGAARRAGVRPAEVPVLLIERAPVVAPEFGPRARAVIESALRSLGVQIRTGVPVSSADGGGVWLDGGERIEADLIVWTAGPRARALGGQLGVSLDPLGRVSVSPDLATGVDGVWAAGDAVRVGVDREHLAMMSCQHAMPQGRQAGANAAAVLAGGVVKDYRQPLYLTCLDLGSAGALLTAGFERDTILAAGAKAKRFKRLINRSLIYPPASASADALLKLGKTAPAGPLAAAVQRLALHSGMVRGGLIGRGRDQAERYAALEVA
jgi:NADH:ubiquinone reductase (H+-translocating)